VSHHLHELRTALSLDPTSHCYGPRTDVKKIQMMLSKKVQSRRVLEHMLEFLFGWVIGVWMGQQFPLPSVQTFIRNWWQTKVETNASPLVEEATSEDHESVPLFTGDMPSPSV